MMRPGISDVLSEQAASRLAELTRRSAADDASAALREALALAGGEATGEREVEALFELLERIEHQSRILQRRLDQLQGRHQLASGATGSREIADSLRTELVVMRSRLKRLHIAACLAQALAYAGSDGSSGRVRALEARLARCEELMEVGPHAAFTTVNGDDNGTHT
jgi:hypothetical protein